MSASENVGRWPGLSYGVTERLLVELQETGPESIRTRFRKLRLRPFPDDIRSGTGIRIAYGLSRILALAAVFDLNRLYVPQGQAVAMVEEAWPEWSRVFLPDAYRDASGLELFVSNLATDNDVKRTPPIIAVDAGRIVDGIVRVTKARPGALDIAFQAVERAFGWTPPSTPHRAAVAGMSRGRGFLDKRPDFERAEALLLAPEEWVDAATRSLAHVRLNALLRYVADPAPIDRWKGEIGIKEDRPRLKHLIAFWADENGMRSGIQYPATKALTIADARVLALECVAQARASR